MTRSKKDQAVDHLYTADAKLRDASSQLRDAVDRLGDSGDGAMVMFMVRHDIPDVLRKIAGIIKLFEEDLKNA